MLDSDGTTVITSDNLGNIPTPGSSDPTKYYVNNFGTSDSQDTEVTIETFGTSDGANYTYLAPDVAGSPGTFSQDPVSLGTIAPLASAPFWARTVQPTGLTADNNPRRVNVVADALTV